MRETPKFPQEFIDYLVTHGWKLEELQVSWLTLRRNDMRIYVKGDTIDVFIAMPDANPRRPFDHLCSFQGWPLLNTFTFMLQMHIMNVVTIPQFMKKLRQEGGKPPTMEQLLEHFQTEALPAGY